MTNGVASRKKSNFLGVSTIPSGSTFDFVVNGTNYKIAVEDLITALGTIGTLTQKGDPTQTPILNSDGLDKQIRNLEDGSGVKASISAYGGARLDHNFQQGSTGAQIIKNITAASPTVRTLVAGTGISVAEQNGFIQIALSATPVSNKTVIVNEIDDFPSPVLGVITLEDDKEYFLANDISTSNRFVMGSSTVLAGSDGTLITLTYTGSDTMFTSVGNSNKIRDIICSCTSGTFIDISCSTCTSIFQAVNIRVYCDEIGSIDGLYLASFQNIIWSVTTDGVKTHNNIPILSFFQNIGTIAAGTFLDLGTATFDGITFSNSQGILPAGTTFMSGLADSGNINAGGLATVINTRAAGAGTPLSGISKADALWEFFGNNGISNSIVSLLGINSGLTVTITTINTPVKIASAWSSTHLSRFTATTGGTFTYTGKGAHVNIIIAINAAITPGPTARNCTFYLYKNGLVITDSDVQRLLIASGPTSVSLPWQEDLETNDTLELYAENNGNSDDIVISSIKFTISG